MLTTRPYEEWADAFTRYFRATIGGPELEGRWRGETIEASAERRRVHLALYWRHGSLRAAWDAYEERVARFFADKPGRLLHFDIFAGDGWEKLCAFLGRDIPAAPFPWRNRGLTVAEDVRPA